MTRGTLAGAAGMALLAVASVAILAWPSSTASGGPQSRPVYRVRQLSAAIRTGLLPGSGYLGQVDPGELVNPVEGPQTPDGWIHVQGQDWHGWVDPLELDGPIDRSTPVAALAPLARIYRF